MTVETNKSKTAKQVMGSYTYDFDFECLLQDPTEEKAKQAIKVTISDGDVETPLTYGSDYTVVLNSDGYGGTVTVADAKDNSYSLVIYREYELTQGSEYQDYNAFPAKTVEGNMDKNLMIAQQQQEQLDRCVQMGITSDIDPATVVAQVERVYTSINNVDVVANNIASVNTVAGDKANVDIVSANISNVNTVAGISSKVTTVANNNASVSAVAGSIAKVNIVADDIAKVGDVADDLTNVDKVADDLTNIDAVAGNATNINAVANNATNINAVNANATNINAVNANKTNINTVAGNISNVNAVANISSDVSTVSGIAADVTAVKNNASNINAVAADLENINSVAADLTNIDNASRYASNANVWAEGTDQEVAALGGVHSSKGWAEVSAQGQIQTDWDQNDSTQKDFIKNKPTALSDFINDLPKKEGIPMSIIEQRRIEISGNTVSLYWQDPRDTIIDGYVLSSWASTTIVKKQGSYPQDVDDGVVVEVVTTRNKYLNSPLIDNQENADNWYYRAFPCSVNGVYCLDKRNCFGVVLFGYRINETDPVPSSRVEYLPFTDNAFYDPCVMDFVSDEFNWGSWERAFFIPKPCALLYNGTVDYYLNPKNFTLKEDGTTSDVRSTAYGGNFMCEFPAIFVKVYKENNYINVLFSNVKIDDDFECWSCKKSDGTYAEHFYLPMFEGTNVNNVLRSVATNGKPTGGLNAETEATYAMANGTGWNTTLWADEMLMMLLFPLLFKSTDSQSVLGYGGSSSTSALTVNNDAAITKGLMYGTSAGSAYGVTYLGLHNWYGHRWRRPNGLMNDNGNYKFKMTHSTIDGSSVNGFNRSGSGYISSGIVPPTASQSYINRYQPIGKYGIVPQATSGSSTTFYCDGMWTNNGQLDQLILGGTVAYGAICGAFCFYVADLPTTSHWTIGSSPSYHTL